MEGLDSCIISHAFYGFPASSFLVSGSNEDGIGRLDLSALIHCFEDYKTLYIFEAAHVIVHFYRDSDTSIITLLSSLLWP